MSAKQSKRSSARSEAQPSEDRTGSGPPPLRRFGLVLHHDGSWTHEGRPITHAKLRLHFDRSVKFLPDEEKFVVTLRQFRGEIEVEESAFFVRMFEPETGRIALSDQSEETLDAATLVASPIDGALLCRVKRNLAPEGLLARFEHAAQAELLHAVEDAPGGMRLRIAGEWRALPGI